MDNVSKNPPNQSALNPGGSTLTFAHAGTGDAREVCNTAINTAKQQQFMGLGEAIECMRRGKKVARRGWNGKGMWLRIRTTGIGLTDDNFYRMPYVEIKAADNSLMPWLCSAADLLANDWVEVP